MKRGNILETKPGNILETKLGGILKNILLTGSAALVFGCSNPVEQEVIIKEKVVMDTIYVAMEELGQDYSYTLALNVRPLAYPNYRLQIGGLFFNESSADIINLRPYFKTYKSKEDRDKDSTLTKNYGHFGRDIPFDYAIAGFFLEDTLDYVPRDSIAYHFTESDTIPFNEFVYYKFKFSHVGEDGSLGRIATRSYEDLIHPPVSEGRINLLKRGELLNKR